jgi:hypothetical protein
MGTWRPQRRPCWFPYLSTVATQPDTSEKLHLPRTTRPLGSAISIGSGATNEASATTWTGRNRGGSGDGCAGSSARSFQLHQYSCFGL